MFGLVSAMATAAAHDTWFHPLSARAGAALLSLGTGNRFPVQEFSVGAGNLRQSGCRSAEQGQVALAAVRDTTKALVMRAVVIDARTSASAPGDGLPAALTCWAQLLPSEIDLPPETVQIYLDEIAAPPSVRDAWADMRSRGIGWKERYTKHARIELHGSSPPSSTPPMPVATGMDMDVLLESGLQAPRPGDPMVFRVLRDGQALPALAMELVGDQGRSGGWHTTDAAGRVRLRAPAPGRWVLRGTDLRVSDTDSNRWESRFVTLAFEVLGPAADAR